MINEDPLISVVLKKNQRVYFPGEELECEYQVDAITREELLAVEASILWFTAGRGDEDFAVHFFERRTAADADDQDLRPMHRIRTNLPNTPLSYAGKLLTIQWCVRIRVFLKKGKEITLDEMFNLVAEGSEHVKQPLVNQTEDSTAEAKE